MEKKNIIIGPGGDYQWGGMDDTHPPDLLKNKAPTIENMRLDKYGIPSKRAGQANFVTAIETWDLDYTADDKPDDATPAWTLTNVRADPGTATVQGDGTCEFDCDYREDLIYTRNPTLSNTDGTTMEMKLKITTCSTGDSRVMLNIDDSTKQVTIKIELRSFDSIFKISDNGDATNYWETTTTPTGWKVIRVQLLGTKAMVWVDNELVLTIFVGNTVTGRIQFFIDGGDGSGGDNITAYIDYVKYVANATTPGQDILGLYTHKEPGREELLCQFGGTLWYSKDGSNWAAAQSNLSRNHSIQAVTVLDPVDFRYKTYLVNGFNRLGVWDLGAYTKLASDIGDPGEYRHAWGRCITAHGDIVLVGHNPMYPNSFYYTRLTKDDGSAVSPASYFSWKIIHRIDIGEGRGIVGMRTMPISRDVITLIGMEDACYSLIGNSTATWDLDKLDSNIGCLARDTMQVWRNQIVFLGQEEGKIGVFGYNGSERVKNLSHGANGSIRAVLESASIPKFRYWLTNRAGEWDLWTYTNVESKSDDAFIEGYVRLSSTNTTGTAESPGFYCGNITEWGVLEADWCQQSVTTNRAIIEIKTATTESGLSGESYTTYNIGEKLQETTGASVWVQIKVTLTRSAGGDTSPRFYFMRPTWLDGGEFRQIPTAWVHEDSYWLALSDGTVLADALGLGYGTKYNNLLLRMDADGNWSEYTAHNATCFTEYRSKFLAGYPFDETIRQLDTGTQDVAANFSATYVSPIISVAPGMIARFDHTAYIETKGVTALNVYYKLDQGSWSSAIAVSPASTNMEAARFTIAAKTYFRTCQIKVEQTTAVSNFEIHKMRFALQVLPRMGD